MGVIWAILSGFGFGLFQSTHRKAGEAIDAYLGTFVLMAVSAFILGVAVLLTEDFSLLVSSPPAALLNFALAGFIHFFLGWTLIGASQRQVGASRTGALIGATPLIAAALAAITLGEILSIPAILGVLLVATGVYFVTR